MATGAREVRDLAAAPSLPSLYARAVTRRGDGGGTDVPGFGLRLTGQVPDAARVAAYAEVCGARFGPDLPPLFPHLLGFPLQLALLTDAASPFPALGLVHVANRVEVLRGIPLGAPLDVEVEMTPVRPHRKGRTVDLVARVSLDGDVVWRSASTYLRRGGGSEDAAAGAADGPGGEDGPEGADTAGELRPSAVWRLPGDLGRRYAAASGDRNPIHLWGLTARAFGFSRPIAHGMWTAARCLAALEGRLAPPFASGVEFRSPLPLPGTVELHTAVGAAGTRFEVRARGKDRRHLTGSASAL
jgi:acyl dehydratase